LPDLLTFDYFLGELSFQKVALSVIFSRLTSFLCSLAMGRILSLTDLSELRRLGGVKTSKSGVFRLNNRYFVVVSPSNFRI
jgi:hypothetical protein